MNSIYAKDLVQKLRQPLLRFRTGILLLPLALLGEVSQLAARWNIEAVDLHQWKLACLGQNKRFLGLNWESLINDLDSILNDRDLPSNCILVYNVDLFLTALLYNEKMQFWAFMRNTFRKSRGLLLTLPDDSNSILPSIEKGCWVDSERLAFHERVDD